MGSRGYLGTEAGLQGTLELSVLGRSMHHGLFPPDSESHKSRRKKKNPFLSLCSANSSPEQLQRTFWVPGSLPLCETIPLRTLCVWFLAQETRDGMEQLIAVYCCTLIAFGPRFHRTPPPPERKERLLGCACRITWSSSPVLASQTDHDGHRHTYCVLLGWCIVRKEQGSTRHFQIV